MRTIVPIFVVGLAIFFVGSSLALASMEVGNIVKLGNSSAFSNRAIASSIEKSPQGSGLGIFTAGLQKDISISAMYEIESISRQSSRTDRSLGEFAAWLYTGFLGDLDNTSYLFSYDGSAAHANALQLGIWEGMDYSANAIKSIMGTKWYNTSSLTLHGDEKNSPAVSWVADYSDSGWTGFGDIWITRLRTSALNPMTGKGGHVTEQLVKLGGGSSLHHPEPVSLIIWAFLGACVGGIYFRRRYRAQQS